MVELHNNKGFSLVGVIVGLGVSMVLALVMAQLMANQAAQLASVRTEMDVAEFIQELRAHLTTAQGTEALLKGNQINTNMRLYDPVVPGRVLLGIGSKPATGGTWTARNILMDQVTPVPNTLGVFRAVLRIVVDKGESAAVGGQIISRTVGTVHCRAANNEIIECFGQAYVPNSGSGAGTAAGGGNGINGDTNDAGHDSTGRQRSGTPCNH